MIAADIVETLSVLRAARRNFGDWPTTQALAELLGDDAAEIVNELKVRHLVLLDAHGDRLVMSSLGFAMFKARTTSAQLQTSQGSNHEPAR